MTNFKDYDALTAERESFGFRVGGKDFELPPDLPAKLVLDVRRNAKKDMTDEEAEDFGFQLIERIIGPESWPYIYEHIGIQGLGLLIPDVLSYYGLGGGEASDGEEGKGPASMTSSSTLEHSTQTSSGSIPIRDDDSIQESSDGTLSSLVSPTFPKAASS